MKRWTIVGLVIAVLACFVLLAAGPQTPQQQMEESNRRLAAERAVIGTKVCSVLVSGNWRDTINVDSQATQAGCREFMNAVKAGEFQLGCLSQDGRVRLGSTGGGRPEPNCGW